MSQHSEWLDNVLEVTGPVSMAWPFPGQQMAPGPGVRAEILNTRVTYLLIKNAGILGSSWPKPDLYLLKSRILRENFPSSALYFSLFCSILTLSLLIKCVPLNLTEVDFI